MHPQMLNSSCLWHLLSDRVPRFSTNALTLPRAPIRWWKRDERSGAAPPISHQPFPSKSSRLQRCFLQFAHRLSRRLPFDRPSAPLGLKS